MGRGRRVRPVFASQRRIAIITESIGFNVNPIEQGSRSEFEARIPAASAGRPRRTAADARGTAPERPPRGRPRDPAR